jgi:GWxTD domain-containing protein
MNAGFRLTQGLFGVVDLQACGGPGFWVNPNRSMEMGFSYGLGLRKSLSGLLSVEIAYRGYRFLEEDPNLRNFHLFSMGMGLHIPISPVDEVTQIPEEAEVVACYLAPELREPLDRFPLEQDELMRRFWESHDPAPETPKNEFREEIRRRIHYANIWFRDAEEGWRTDRGRVWILYGEPDEIIVGEERVTARLQHIDHTVCWIYHRKYRGVSPLVFVFQRSGALRQVFSNVPGESGYLRKIGPIDPEIDRYTRRVWPAEEY